MSISNNTVSKTLIEKNYKEIKSMDKQENIIFPCLSYDEPGMELEEDDINAYLKLDNGDTVPQLPLHSSDLKREIYLVEFEKNLITGVDERDEYIIKLENKIESLKKQKRRLT